jgi:hypothetical protein
MPSIGNWTRNFGHKANRFFGKVQGYTKEGVKFLNHKILPGARTAHRFLTTASQEIGKDPNVSEKNRDRLNSLSKLADVGIKRLQDTTDTINRVSAAV